MDTYAGRDTKVGNVWREHTEIPPYWSNTDCVMTSFKPRMKRGVDDVTLPVPKATIPKPQINIIKSSVAAFMSECNDVAASDEGEE